MLVTEKLDPLELLSELLLGRAAAEEETRRFARLGHNADLCPGFRDRILRTLSAYRKHRLDVHDVQGFQDRGVDVAVRIDGDDGARRVGLQIKSDAEIVAWKKGRTGDFVSTIRNQCMQAIEEAKVDLVYLVLCADAVEHRDHLRTVVNTFGAYRRVKIVGPEQAWGFFSMDEAEVDVAVTRLLCAGDFLLHQAVAELDHLSGRSRRLAVDLLFRGLDGETSIGHDDLVRLLVDGRGSERTAEEEPEELLAALTSCVVEDLGVHEGYRIRPDALPSVCAVFYDQFARHGDRAGARRRTGLLLT